MTSQITKENNKILETATALTCMAHAIFFESRSEPIVAQIAVGHVIMNRVHDHRFPDTVCDVVTDGLRYQWNNKMVKHQCAFSFYCDGKAEDVSIDPTAYEWAEEISYGILNGMLNIDLTDGSTHYHADYVYPSWANTMTKTVCIDTHCFYRWEHE